jgi:hypothetical protein
VTYPGSFAEMQTRACLPYACSRTEDPYKFFENSFMRMTYSKTLKIFLFFLTKIGSEKIKGFVSFDHIAFKDSTPETEFMNVHIL